MNSFHFKHWKKIITSTIIALTTLCSIIILYAVFLNSPVPPKNRQAIQSEQDFYVEVGKNLNTIFHQLEQEQYIRNANFLKFYNKIFLKKQLVQAGQYDIPKNLTSIKVLHHLLSAPAKQTLVSITIPEGLSLREVANIWQELGFFSSSEFIDASTNPQLLDRFNIHANSFEGWLFPDTYMVPETISATEAVYLMASQFHKVLTDIYPGWENLPIKEINDKVILASIIQKEHKVAEDAPLMASVFFNRLSINMPLQVDATIAYIKKEQLGQSHAQRIFWKDLEVDNPYNTYKNAGIPPSPIGLPGKIALQAVFYPAQTNYFFFVVIPGSGGKHHFSTSFGEHKRYAQIYRNQANKDNIL